MIAAVRYLEDSSSGKGFNYYVPRANVRASGSMSMKSRDTEEQLQIICRALDPTTAGAPQLFINGQSA